MQTRPFAHTGDSVSEIGLGCWQLGSADWGTVDDDAAQQTLQAAVTEGVTFFDTADIYGGGQSELRLGRFLAGYAGKDTLRVATKFGRSAVPGGDQNLSYAAMHEHTSGSLARLGQSKLWLTQGHCLSTEALRQGSVFSNLRKLQHAGLIEHFGMSVESLEQARICLDVEGLCSLQVIFNVLRQKLAFELFEKAAARGVAVIVRLPLASGLLSGALKPGQVFAASDHRHYNRDGQAFNVGETFSGLPFELGTTLVAELAGHIPSGYTPVDFALRYCLDFPAVSSVIPGARSAAQVRANVRASELPRLPAQCHATLEQFYRERVHAHIRGVY